MWDNVLGYHTDKPMDMEMLTILGFVLIRLPYRITIIRAFSVTGDTGGFCPEDLDQGNQSNKMILCLLAASQGSTDVCVLQ